MRRASWVLLVGFFLVLLAAPSPAFAYYEVFDRSFRLPAGGSFELSNMNGSVEVEGWEREEVHIRAVKYSKTNPSDEARVRIQVESAPDVVSVHTFYPREDGLDVTVEYQVQVPARLLRASIGTVNGNVRVRGIEASGELRTVNGNVELLDGAGHIGARTTNGNVRLELADFGRPGEGRGPILVETVNGSVVLEVPAGARAELEVRNLNGDFQSELPFVLLSSTGAQEFRARLGRGGSTVRLRTVNGGIRIETARNTV